MGGGFCARYFIAMSGVRSTMRKAKRGDTVAAVGGVVVQ